MVVEKSVVYPVQIRSVVSKMTSSCQKALENRVSRMEVELPPAVDWGVEIKKSNGGSTATTNSNLEKIRKSNREAARLFIEMFAVLSSTTVVLFPSEIEAIEARNSWQSFKGQCLSMDAPTKSAKGYGKLRSRRFSAEEQEAVLLGDDGIYIPEGCEVVIIAGPRAKDFKAIRKMSDKLGEGVCIIALNGRFETVKATTDKSGVEESEDGKYDWYEKTFVNVFHYAPPALPSAESTSAAAKRDLLLYHEYSTKWSLAEKKDRKGEGIMSAVKSLAENPFSTVSRWESKPSPKELLLAADGASPAIEEASE